jgi:epoxyqueuosine reductase QueG
MMNKSIAPNDLRILIENYVAEYPGKNRERNIWRKPLLATAKADDRFDILSRIAAADHLQPQDLLSSAKAVVVFFLPFVKELAAENHRGEIPCRNWGLAYESTNRLITSLCLHKNGHKCLVCIERCPVGAVSESGIDRKLCWERLKSNLIGKEELSGLENTTHVCGKCQVLVPCSLRAPKKAAI